MYAEVYMYIMAMGTVWQWKKVAALFDIISLTFEVFFRRSFDIFGRNKVVESIDQQKIQKRGYLENVLSNKAHSIYFSRRKLKKQTSTRSDHSFYKADANIYQSSHIKDFKNMNKYFFADG